MKLPIIAGDIWTSSEGFTKLNARARCPDCKTVLVIEAGSGLYKSGPRSLFKIKTVVFQSSYDFGEVCQRCKETVLEYRRLNIPELGKPVLFAPNGYQYVELDERHAEVTWPVEAAVEGGGNG